MTDLTSFNTWVADHNIIVYLTGIPPTDIQITDTTLISQLEDIHQFLTRYGYSSTVVGNLPIVITQTNLT